MARSTRKFPAHIPAAPPRGSRSQWILGAAVALAAIAGIVWWAARPVRRGAVVIISIDTLRADHLPIYGYAHGRTPTIDALARDAVVFDRAYAHAPQTLPSHSSILTGLLPFEHGVRDNLGFTLKPNTPTLASMFRTNGYQTGGFVSAYVLRKETGIGQGFDVYNAEFPAGSQERSVAQVQRGGLETLAAAETWLDSLTNSQFFLFFHIYEPHKPYTPPSEYADLKPYDGEIAFADAIVGKLLGDLKRRGWYDDATIVLLSDHGEGLGDHGEEEHGLFLYDATIHVPLVVKLAHERSSGRRIADPVQHIDLVPTLADLAGVHAPSSLRGRDLRPALESATHPAPQGIYSEAMYSRYHFGWSELLALTDERYRFVKAPRPELYDLDRDPQEHDNLAAVRVPVAQAMRSGLDALVAGHGIDAPGAVSAEDRERLAALGYVGTTAARTDQPGDGLPDPKDKVAVLEKYRDAVTAAGQGRFVDAATLLKLVVSQEPAMADAWSQYGTVLLKLGRNEDALAAFKEVITHQPGETLILIDIANVLMRMARYDEARATAELAVTASPAAAHQTLAQIALARNDQATALREAALGEQADATLPLTDYVRGLGEYNQHHYEAALPYLMRAYDRVGARTMQITDLRFYIGDSLAYLERYPEAERFFKEEIAIYPNSFRARSALAMVYQATSRSDEAERAISQMVTIVPTPDSYERAEHLWRMFGRPDRAEAVAAARRARFGK